MSWKNKPTNFTKTVEKDASDFTTRVGFKVLRQLTITSPKDSGRFIGNWLVGLITKKHSILDRTDPTRTKALASGKSVMKRHKFGQSIFISNNLPYASKLNDGHSGQAPANFVQRAIKKVASE